MPKENRKPYGAAVSLFAVCAILTIVFFWLGSDGFRFAVGDGTQLYWYAIAGKIITAAAWIFIGIFFLKAFMTCIED
ncbi:hypothetical protein [Neomegalonema sp.]|uniref:hypothetical protein n=1 Tax=Neomegalonema sp. TaxID=2039713 RepID=UPI00261D59A4|nr:hypothetical protein [Neomegalonema sp.]MDD2869619.1 hypothetical protein [Neomegalonema sp.]